MKFGTCVVNDGKEWVVYLEFYEEEEGEERQTESMVIAFSRVQAVNHVRSKGIEPEKVDKLIAVLAQSNLPEGDGKDEPPVVVAEGLAAKYLSIMVGLMRHYKRQAQSQDTVSVTLVIPGEMYRAMHETCPCCHPTEEGKTEEGDKADK